MRILILSYRPFINILDKRIKNIVLPIAMLLIVISIQAQENFSEELNIVNSKLRSIENKGQWEDQVKFRITLNCGQMFLENDGFTYNFISDDDLVRIEEEEHHHNKPNTKEKRATEKKYNSHHGLKMNFVGANPNCLVKGINAYETNYNYYLGNNPEKWSSGSKAFKGVKYESVYEGINIYLYEKNGYIKYDFIVSPNENPELIVLKYEGEDSIYLQNGNLKIVTSVNDITEQKPIAYQLIEGNKKEIECQFILTKNKEIKFSFPNGFNESYPLMIDPILIFSTYSGSTGDNWGYTATYDNTGNAYSGGIAYNEDGGSYSGYPTTFGAFERNFQGGVTDVAISKYSPDGSTLLYATYLGGNSNDIPMSMIVNSKNELVVLGITASFDFPITLGAYDNILNNGGTGFYDLFTAILSPTGSSLIGSTFIGGSVSDGYNYFNYFYGDNFRSEVVVDDLDNIYVASNTTSNDFPTTVGSFDNSFNGEQDACVFKLNSNCSNLIWSGILGGTGLDQSSGIVLDSLNNVYVCGATEGNSFPITPATINQVFQGGLNVKGVNSLEFRSDGFVTKISADGSAIIASTYLQSTNNAFDIAYLIAKDEDENIYVLGNTEGTYPISSSVYNNGASSQFIHKLNADLTTTLFSSTFGNGSNSIMLSPSALMIDNCYRIYVSGWGGELSFFYDFDNNIDGLPISQNAYQTTTDGSDFYLTVFGQDMSTLNYATYLGGIGSNDHVDGGTSRFSPDGIVYQAVCASCREGDQSFPSTPGAYSTTNKSLDCNAAVFKMEFQMSVVVADIENKGKKDTFCYPDEVVFENLSWNGNEFKWYFGDDDSLYTNSYSTISHIYPDTGVYQATLIASNDGICFSKPLDTAYYLIDIRLPPEVDAGEDTAIICGDVTLNGCCGPFYNWVPNENITDREIQNPTVNTISTTVYYLTVTDRLGCTSTDSVEIEVIEVDVEIPNIITPNNDGFNELFIIEGICGESKVTLYNRWGKMVYQREKYKNNFDGGNLVDGTYYYLIETEYEEEYKGWLQILK